jgi:hypothetical protein
MSYQGKTVGRVFEYPSLSNPDLPPWVTTLWTDGTTSCNCPGWTRHCVDGQRACRHTMTVDKLVETVGLDVVLSANTSTPALAPRKSARVTRSAPPSPTTIHAATPTRRRIELNE